MMKERDGRFGLEWVARWKATVSNERLCLAVQLAGPIRN